MLNKRFLILGNKNSIGYKEIFPLLKDNKVWLGFNIHSGVMKFQIPKYIQPESSNCHVDDYGNVYVETPVARWFTNLGDIYRPEPLDLSGNYYSPEKYPKYDNYNAINVDKVADIPCDYAGVMGVPITFMDKYNPEQFEIVCYGKGNDKKHLRIKNKYPFSRILIRNKKPVVK